MATQTKGKKRWQAPIPEALVKLKKSLKTPEAFEALPAHQKRLVIAADVIEWLDTKKIIAKQGTYVDKVASYAQFFAEDVKLKGVDYDEDEYFEGEDEVEEVENADLRTLVLERVAEKDINNRFCACAMGAAAIATVARANKLKVDGDPLAFLADVANLEDEGGTADSNYGNEEEAYMAKYFPPFQLRMMEAAFERHEVYVTEEGERKPFPVLLDFEGEEQVMYMPRLRSAYARLRSIYLNVIRNRGAFDPLDTI